MSNLNHFELKNKFIQSPLNYTGGKFKLLNQLLPLFPKENEIIVDLFCGGANVGLNLKASKLILNDKQKELIELFALFKRLSFEELFKALQSLIEEYKLSQSAKFGYEFYKCDSTKGLSSHNKEPFLRLRKAYNQDKDPLKLFLLIVFGFNNQIRFNLKKEFNLPCGKRDFNLKIQEKLRLFMAALKTRQVFLENKDFRAFDIKNLDKNSFVYIDPPYFLANASYNENKAWSKDDECDLLEFLKMLDSKKIKFALSNVLFHKQKEHIILKKWLEKNPKFRLVHLNFSYKNCNYQSKNDFSQEILLRNY
ncbi:DNA adenine methylase [Campylobacter sp. MIT 99-7217]|uniref:DNA adenine methylase n=1 Tax=Campylobacter sp. MIT 99-7217 TaxID=535091 RepID=UPI00115A6165|nr:Dam family site-specific DNA-(adenine-N6)-methyltransferase [Campylobacter sp. MIT 99-7217]TQR31389.1 DNA adenine methylase [Campylobacter sp. MIT 99-7217]